MITLLRRKSILLILVTVMIIAILALTVNSILGGLGIDSSLFDQGACEAPCWQGLTPGHSTSNDVESFLSNLSATKWPIREITEYDTGCKWIRLIDYSRLGVVDLYIENDRLTFIQSFRPNKTRLGNIVDHFGPPEYFKSILAIGPDGNLPVLEVYYPKQGLGFAIPASQNNIAYQSKIGQIKANMIVDTIQYFEPGDLLEYFNYRYSCFLGKATANLRSQTEIDSYVQPWSGFGEVNVIPAR